MSELVLDGVVIPRGSELAFSYSAARTDRFRDFNHIASTPISEAAMLPQWERNTITARLRHLVRNNEYVAALVSTFAVHLGNSTLRAHSPDKAYNDAKERFWLNYSRSCELTGLSLAEVEEIIYTELLVAGEVFFLKLATGKIQLVPSEYVFSGKEPEEREIQGIVYDGTGNPTFYRIGSRDSRGTLKAGEKPIPAAQVIHLYRKDRAEMLRGVPWLSSAVNAIQDLSEIVAAKVMSVKSQSFISAVVTRNVESALPNLADGADSNGTRTKHQTLKNGTIYYLENGEDIKAFQSQFQSQDFDAFLLSRLRAVGACIGLPLELFVEGFKDSNYSSARSTNLLWGKKVRSIRRLIERRFLEPLNLWASERARAANLLKGESAYDAETSFGWPTIPAIDEAKEAEANIKKLNAGLTTYSAIYAENNLFFDDEIKVRARDARLILEAAKTEGISPQLIVPDYDFLAASSEPPAPELTKAA